MNKKIFALFILSLFILPLVLNLVNSQPDTSTIFGISPDSGVKLTEKWEYLGKEWKNILMGNPFIKGVDSFFQNINFIFVILFGMEYSLSIALLLTIALWMYIFFLFNRISINMIFSKGVALLISFGLTILIAQIGLFSKMVNFIIGIFFGEQPWWVKVIIGLAIFVILAVFFIVMIKFGKQIAANRKKLKEEKDRLKLHTGAVAGEELSKAIGGKR